MIYEVKVRVVKEVTALSQEPIFQMLSSIMLMKSITVSVPLIERIIKLSRRRTCYDKTKTQRRFAVQ